MGIGHSGNRRSSSWAPMFLVEKTPAFCWVPLGFKRVMWCQLGIGGNGNSGCLKLETSF